MIQNELCGFCSGLVSDSALFEASAGYNNEIDTNGYRIRALSDLQRSAESSGCPFCASFYGSISAADEFQVFEDLLFVSYRHRDGFSVHSVEATERSRPDKSHLISHSWMMGHAKGQ
jgi:hypothetical protein